MLLCSNYFVNLLCFKLKYLFLTLFLCFFTWFGSATIVNMGMPSQYPNSLQSVVNGMGKCWPIYGVKTNSVFIGFFKDFFIFFYFTLILETKKIVFSSVIFNIQKSFVSPFGSVDRLNTFEIDSLLIKWASDPLVKIS